MLHMDGAPGTQLNSRLFQMAGSSATRENQCDGSSASALSGHSPLRSGVLLGAISCTAFAIACATTSHTTHGNGSERATHRHAAQQHHSPAVSIQVIAPANACVHINVARKQGALCTQASTQPECPIEGAEGAAGRAVPVPGMPHPRMPPEHKVGRAAQARRQGVRRPQPACWRTLVARLFRTCWGRLVPTKCRKR